MDSLPSVILPQPQFQKQQQIHRDFSHKNKHSLHHFIHLFIKIKLPHLKKKPMVECHPSLERKLSEKIQGTNSLSHTCWQALVP